MNHQQTLDELKNELRTCIQTITNLPEQLRPRTTDGEAGGLIDLSGTDKEVYIMGDVHGNLHNLKMAFETDELMGKIQRNEAVLILLGDLVHEDRVGYLTEMQPSLSIFEFVVHLINQYPGNIIYTMGNHDTFDPYLTKSGIKQGLYFYQAILDSRDEEYAGLMQEMFESLPVMVQHDQFLAVHAGPIRGGCTREHVVEIKKYPEDYWQLIWNRMNMIGSIPNRKEYDHNDIEATREAFGKDQSCYFIVGHNPLFDRGGSDSVWFNVMGVPNYVILYSAHPEMCPMMKFEPGNGVHSLLNVDLKLYKSRFALGDIY